jgi:hypothetical protein
MKLKNVYQIGWLLPAKSPLKMYLNLDTKNWKILGSGIILERRENEIILVIRHSYIDFELTEEWNDETRELLYKLDQVSERDDFSF